jgi:hypothetical protein
VGCAVWCARESKRTCQTTLPECSSVTKIASRRLLTSSPGTGSPGADNAAAANTGLRATLVTRIADPDLAALTSGQRLRGDSAFHRRLTERLLPEWTGIDYVQDVGVAERIPHIWDGDGLQLLTQLSDGTTAELTWMLDRNRVRTALDRLRRGELDSKQVSAANRLLTTFAVLAEAERDFDELNAELAAVAWR